MANAYHGSRTVPLPMHLLPMTTETSTFPSPEPELPRFPGLLVRVTVTADGCPTRECIVDFTRHEGRRHIADIAQWAMPRGYSLTTVKVQP